MITPEYNRSIPGVLKNAIDSIFVPFAFRNKPVAAVAYSGGLTGGARAVEHLTQIAVETEAVPLRSSLSIPNIETAFSPEGEPTEPLADAKLGILLDDLAWWSAVLGQARATGEVPPAVLRMRAAMTSA